MLKHWTIYKNLFLIRINIIDFMRLFIKYMCNWHNSVDLAFGLEIEDAIEVAKSNVWYQIYLLLVAGELYE